MDVRVRVRGGRVWARVTEFGFRRHFLCFDGAIFRLELERHADSERESGLGLGLGLGLG